jgi:hypothetical protein
MHMLVTFAKQSCWCAISNHQLYQLTVNPSSAPLPYLPCVGCRPSMMEAYNGRAAGSRTDKQCRQADSGFCTRHPP